MENNNNLLLEKYSENLSYIAGFLDAVNPFWFSLSTREDGRLRLRTDLRLNSEDSYIIYLIKHLFGGTIKTKKNSFWLRMGNEQLYALCKSIVNYSFIHKEVINKIIQVYEEKNSNELFNGKHISRSYKNKQFNEELRNLYFKQEFKLNSYDKHLNEKLLPNYTSGLFDGGGSCSISFCKKNIVTKVIMQSYKPIIPIIFKTILNLSENISPKKQNILVIQNLNSVSKTINYLFINSFKNKKRFNILKQFLLFKQIGITPSEKQKEILKNFHPLSQDKHIFKLCNKCHNIKLISEFREHHECKSCEHIRTQIYYSQNSKQILAQKRKNKVPRLNKDGLSNPIKIIQYRARRNAIHRIKKEKIKLLLPPRQLLGCSTKELSKYLESKFTPEMSWENYGSYWHIDHIIPLSYFDMTKLEDQKQCCNYKNLQPLTAIENMKKGNRLL